MSVRLTDWTNGDRESALHNVEQVLGGASDVEIMRDPRRRAGLGYYEAVCFKIHATAAGGELEVGDGGFTSWTGRLLADRKERLCISAVSVDRLAGLGGPGS
jgi:hypothetical protein